MAMKTIVALAGQGIGPEVVDATCEPLMGTGLSLKILTPPQGNPLPEETKCAARENGEGIYPGRDGAQGEGPRHRGAIRREIARFAVELARTRKAQGGTAKTRDMAQAVLAAYRG